MRTVKILSLVLTMAFFSQCKSTKFDTNPPFTITDASYNNWVGGQPGVKGMKVIIGYTANSDISFDQLYFAKRITKLEKHTKDGKTYLIGHYNTSENEMVIGDKATKASKDTFPFELKTTEAVLSFKDGNMVKYVKIEKVKETKTDFYP